MRVATWNASERTTRRRRRTGAHPAPNVWPDSGTYADADLLGCVRSHLVAIRHQSPRDLDAYSIHQRANRALQILDKVHATPAKLTASERPIREIVREFRSELRIRSRLGRQRSIQFQDVFDRGALLRAALLARGIPLSAVEDLEADYV